MSSATSHLSAEARASLPQHVAVIMDGNGRWAKQHGLPRIEGHRRGADSAREIIRTAGELGIKYLTLYAFSAENWNRPKDEVDALMKYLVHYLKTETKDLNKNNVRLEVIGQIHRLPDNVQEHLAKSIAAEGMDGLLGDLPPALLSTLARTADGPCVERLERSPGIHYVLLDPLPNGTILTVGVGPRTRYLPPDRVARFLRGAASVEPPYTITLSLPTPADLHQVSDAVDVRRVPVVPLRSGRY